MMSDKDGAFLFIGTYPDEALAGGDYEVVKQMHHAKVIGNYDAAVVTKDASGKVHVSKDETMTRKGAWTGIAAGAVLGVLFPPSLIGSAAVLGAAGGVAGHLWKGLSRQDVKDLGDVIDAGQAALIVVGDNEIAQALDNVTLNAVKQIRKQVDVNRDDLDKEIKEAGNI
jgi:uncharacterized membrane protein